MSDASLMSGFPAEPDALVTLANWQDPPYNRWAFQHLREVIPTQRIARGADGFTPLPYHERQLDPAAVNLTRVMPRADGEPSTLAEVIADTSTDAVVILHDGRIVYEHYENGMTPDTPHLLMSVTKSVVGCIAGILVDNGELDPAEQISHYVPEVTGSGYGGATVRNLLDMRTGVVFREEYTDVDAEIRVMERHIGWRPTNAADKSGGMYAYLATMRSDVPHGGRFVYRSADTDMLGWVCERAAGTRMADLISQLIWQPMGAEFDAEITCDGLGSAIHDGGMSARARDMARFGQMVLRDGAVGGNSVIPRSWLASTRTIDPDIRSAFAASNNESVISGGWYRSQFWFMPGVRGDLQVCLGIHGQMVLVDRANRTVSVKLSTWPAAQNTVFLLDTVRAFVAAGEYLSGNSQREKRSQQQRDGVAVSPKTGPIGVVEGRSRGRA